MISIVCVEGMIGAGKSTMMKRIIESFERDHFRVIICDEPLQLWLEMKNNNGNNLLGEYYSDTSRWGYLFQSVAFRTRIKALEESRKLADRYVDNKHTIILTERSIFADRNVFAKLLFDTGKMSLLEWTDYIAWFDWLAEEFKSKCSIDYWIYLDVSFNKSLERIHKRAREEEKSVDESYLKLLHEKYDTWFNSLELNDKQYMFDADVELDGDQYMDALNIILESIKACISL